jgi:hypothetical protein
MRRCAVRSYFLAGAELASLGRMTVFHPTWSILAETVTPGVALPLPSLPVLAF